MRPILLVLVLAGCPAPLELPPEPGPGTGSSCRTDADCAGAACLHARADAGFCSRACSGDSGCSGGARCLPFSDYAQSFCIPPDAPLLGIGERCAEDGMCASGNCGCPKASCVEGEFVCRPAADGADCDVDRQCASGYCSCPAGFCGCAPPACGPAVYGTCRVRAGAGGDCEVDADCREGLCVQRKCRLAALAQECGRDADCEAGLVCVQILRAYGLACGLTLSVCSDLKKGAPCDPDRPEAATCAGAACRRCAAASFSPGDAAAEGCRLRAAFDEPAGTGTCPDTGRHAYAAGLFRCE